MAKTKWQPEITVHRAAKLATIEIKATYTYKIGRWSGKRIFRKGDIVNILGLEWNADKQRPWQTDDVEDEETWNYKDDLFLLVHQGNASAIEFVAKSATKHPPATSQGLTALIVTGWATYYGQGLMCKVKDADGKMLFIKPTLGIFQLDEADKCLVVEIQD